MENACPAFTTMHEGTKLLLPMDTTLTVATKYQRIVGKPISFLHKRPDLSNVIHMVSKFMHTPDDSHMQAALGIIRCNSSAILH